MLTKSTGDIFRTIRNQNIFFIFIKTEIAIKSIGVNCLHNKSVVCKFHKHLIKMHGMEVILYWTCE